MPGKKVVFKTPWFFVEEEFFGVKPWYRVVEPNAVCAFAMTKDQKIVLVRQFRPAVNEYTLEMPAGHIDKGEDALSSAKRELYEETGYSCGEWVCLASGVLMLASRSTMRSDLFFASGAVLDPSFIPKEKIEVKLATLDELKSLILNSECRQNSIAGALQIASWRGLIPKDF